MLQLCPPSGLEMVVAYRNTGSISKADTSQTDRDTILAISPVLNLGEEIGWQTATYRSAERTIRKRELVIWLMQVETM